MNLCQHSASLLLQSRIRRAEIVALATLALGPDRPQAAAVSPLRRGGWTGEPAAASAASALSPPSSSLVDVKGCPLRLRLTYRGHLDLLCCRAGAHCSAANSARGVANGLRTPPPVCDASTAALSVWSGRRESVETAIHALSQSEWQQQGPQPPKHSAPSLTKGGRTAGDIRVRSGAQSADTLPCLDRRISSSCSSRRSD